MSAHTPGPWTYERKNGTRHIRDAEGNSFICDEGYYPWVSDNEADWPLIAAAPTLLAALKDVVAVLRVEGAGTWLNNKKYDAVGINAYAAIAKAEGR